MYLVRPSLIDISQPEQYFLFPIFFWPSSIFSNYTLYRFHTLRVPHFPLHSCGLTWDRFCIRRKAILFWNMFPVHPPLHSLLCPPAMWETLPCQKQTQITPFRGMFIIRSCDHQKSTPCSGFIRKLATISFCGNWYISILPAFNWSFKKKYLTFMCRVYSLMDYLPITSNLITLYLS